MNETFAILLLIKSLVLAAIFGVFLILFNRDEKSVKAHNEDRFEA